jgi:hypothetical protein
MTPADKARDSYLSWSIAIACLREMGVRRGDYPPVDDRERRWAAEGPREAGELESLKEKT